MSGRFFSPYSDEARRCSDIVQLHLVAEGTGAMGKWVAIRMSDGGSDNTLYDTKQQAIRHQLHEQQCCYLVIPPSGMNPRQAENFLKFNRAMYANGMRMIDPDSDASVHIPTTYAGGKDLHGR